MAVNVDGSMQNILTMTLIRDKRDLVIVISTQLENSNVASYNNTSQLPEPIKRSVNKEVVLQESEGRGGLETVLEVSR